jgi:hypothetical protein
MAEGTPPARARSASRPLSSAEHAGLRELFWHNVVREFLTSLSMLHARRTAGQAPADGPDIFDGRLAIITSFGARVPIGAVYPLFACSVSGTKADRALAMELECTVFQVDTPQGESYTLPLHEVRAFHSLSAELVDQIKQASQEAEPDDAREEMPFGFAAFTSLAKSRAEPPAWQTFSGPDFPLPG